MQILREYEHGFVVPEYVTPSAVKNLGFGIRFFRRLDPWDAIALGFPKIKRYKYIPVSAPSPVEQSSSRQGVH